MGFHSPFFVYGVKACMAQSDVAKLVERVVEGLGLDLAYFELSNRASMLRVFIDRPFHSGVPFAGITVEDCERVTRQLQRVFEVEGVEYVRLEVSSPGLDRRLLKASDYARFSGQQADVRLRDPIDGRRRFVGQILEVNGETVELGAESARVKFSVADVERARLVPKV